MVYKTRMLMDGYGLWTMDMGHKHSSLVDTMLNRILYCEREGNIFRRVF
jgi:hypothetical protein